MPVVRHELWELYGAWELELPLVLGCGAGTARGTVRECELCGVDQRYPGTGRVSVGFSACAYVNQGWSCAAAVDHGYLESDGGGETTAGVVADFADGAGVCVYISGGGDVLEAESEEGEEGADEAVG